MVSSNNRFCSSLVRSKSIRPMSNIAAAKNTLYRFSGTNYGYRGWLIQKYAGVSNDLEENTCWFFYVRHRGGHGFRPNKGVSKYLLTVEETIVTFRYELDTKLCRE